MLTPPVSPSRLGAADAYVKAFEAAWAGGGCPSVEAFAPPPDDPLYRPVVRELVRVDLELRWGRGQPRPLDDYRSAFPDVFRDRPVLGAIAFEEYRQRRVYGEDPSPAEYARRYGVCTDDWPGPGSPADGGDAGPPLGRTVVTGRGPDLEAASLAYRQFRTHQAPASGDGLDALPTPPGDTDAVDLFRAVHRTGPNAAGRLAEATLPMPEVGGEFLGFRLIEELGRGAFGRVFLAHQGDLADRPVALKISADLPGESQTLARLQHTNIVPIHSVHRAGVFQAVCMPYVGSTTLADLLRGLRDADALPASGKHLVSTLNDRRSRTREAPPRPSRHRPDDAPAAAEPAASTAADPAPPGTPPAAAGPAALLDRFNGWSYVEAVLWLGARLADGLVHAHERGVVHRDLKPANVLLADDGQPMLLDFNLSDDSKLRGQPSAARVGGTLPYMAPEQLQAFPGRVVVIDARSDLYSLGVMLFELLTGKFPFPLHGGPPHVCLPLMIEDRRQSPRLCPLNKAVSPAVESIIRRCLAPELADRYQSARELQEDLERQLDHRPLRYAPDPSPQERFWKWTRRHPRLSSSTTVAAAAAVLLLALTSGAAVFWHKHLADLEAKEHERARLAAADGLNRLELARHAQQALLNDTSSAAVHKVIELSRGSLDDYRVADDPAWQDAPLVQNLAPADRTRLRADVAEMLVNWADAERQRAESEADGGRRRDGLVMAWSLNERAEACLGGATDSPALWGQRARLARLLGKDEADTLARKAARLVPKTTFDQFQLARGYLRRREFQKAIPPLLEVTRLDPRHFWAWYFLGNCHYEQFQLEQAFACYTACVGLNPDPSVAYFAYFQRGLVHAARQRDDQAEDDFRHAAALLASLPPDLQARERPRPALELARLLARRKDYAAAEKVLTDALEAHGPETQLLLERAGIREQRGDAAGAERDRADGLRREPADEAGWNARGLARLAADPRGALADFEQALRLNPQYHLALQNKAHVLAERLGRADESLAVLNQIVALYPGFVPARIGRGVVHARQGRRAAAHADAVASLARDRSPITLYQAANIYALTSRQEPADRERVIPLLAAALWAGFGLDLVDQDADMDPVRDLPSFKRVVEVVRELRGEVKRQSP